MGRNRSGEDVGVSYARVGASANVSASASASVNVDVGAGMIASVNAYVRMRMSAHEIVDLRRKANESGIWQGASVKVIIEMTSNVTPSAMQRRRKSELEKDVKPRVTGKHHDK